MTDMNSMPPVIWHYPVSDLPQDPAARYGSDLCMGVACAAAST